MNVFVKLVKARKNLKETLEKLQTEDEFYKLEKEKLESLDIIYDYMLTYSWLQRKNAKDKMQSLVEHNFNPEKVAYHLGTTASSVHASRTYLANVFEDKIGKNTIDLILEGNIETGLLQFRMGTGFVSMSKIINDDIYDMIEKTSGQGNLIRECEGELKFLKLLAYNTIQSRLAMLDSSKFGLIDKIMNTNDMLYAKERILIFKYLTNEITNIDQLFSLIEYGDNFKI